MHCSSSWICSLGPNWFYVSTSLDNGLLLPRQQTFTQIMMTSSNGNIFRVTGHLCGEFTSDRWLPAQRPVTRTFDVFFDLRLNKRLSKRSWAWSFETPSCSLWRHCNVSGDTNIPRAIRNQLEHQVKTEGRKMIILTFNSQKDTPNIKLTCDLWVFIMSNMWNTYYPNHHHIAIIEIITFVMIFVIRVVIIIITIIKYHDYISCYQSLSLPWPMIKIS